MKGEKGITILAPILRKKTVEEMKLDPDGNIISEKKTVESPLLKPVKVFLKNLYHLLTFSAVQSIIKRMMQNVRFSVKKKEGA